MTGLEYRTVIRFEHDLKTGDKVNVCWTNCGNIWEGIGTISKINAKTFNVTLTEPVLGPYLEELYSVGRLIQVPRIEAIRQWSINNRVEPIGGYQPVEKSS